MKKILIVTLIFLMSFTVFGAKIGDDTLKIGKPGSSADKIISLGGNRLIRSNETSGKVEFSNDGGSNWKAVGAGGGGGGENYNNGFSSDNNPDAETGTSGWTASAGVFTTVANSAGDPLGDASFTWTPVAQNDYVEGSVLNFDRDIFKGKECEARIEYIGGDENLSLQVVNGNNIVTHEEVLKAHSTWGQESVWFLCPSDADIVGDAQLGNLRYRITNTGASASPLVKFDKSYLGTLRGLTEVTTPDVFSAQISGGGVVFNENVDWIDGNCTVTGTSRFQCFYNAGLVTVPMNCVTSSIEGTQDTDANLWESQATFFRTYTSISSTDTASARGHNVICTKQGVDAKQSVQVYKSIPKVAENVNEFSSIIDGAGNILSSNVQWLSSCARNTVGEVQCNFDVGLFGQTPVCNIIGLQVFTNDRSYAIHSIGSASVSWHSFTVGGAAVDSNTYHLKCQKQDHDFKMPTVQPVIVGQVTNSWAEVNGKNWRTEACFVTMGGGTPSDGDSYCSTWIDSYTDNGQGDTTVNYKSGMWAERPNCSCLFNDSYPRPCGLLLSTVSNVNIKVFDNDAVPGGGIDRNFMLKCEGPRG